MSEHSHNQRTSHYKADSLSLIGAVAMGTGVMIGAGIFALTGQVAELAGRWFSLAFLAAAVVTAFSAYSYVKLSNAYPSAGGIAMFLKKAYGKSTMTGGCALLMYFSMVINESLVARTFGTYTLQLFDAGDRKWLVPALGVALLAFAFVVNIMSNRLIETLSFFMAFLKIGGIAVFGIAGLWVSGLTFQSVSIEPAQTSVGGFLGAVAIGILAYKGFTTITNSGAEIVDPHRNVGRAITISIAICVVVYLIVAFAVGSSLSLDAIVKAKDYALAEAAGPTLGRYGFYFTVALALVATASGLLASVFAVSRMLAMLTDMKMIPHSHFGMSGPIREHTLVYTVVTAGVLTIFFDLSRIASLGAFFYLVMDILIHWGVLKSLRREIGANGWIMIAAIALDTLVLAVFAAMKLQSDPTIVVIAALAIAAVFAFERVYLTRWIATSSPDSH